MTVPLSLGRNSILERPLRWFLGGAVLLAFMVPAKAQTLEPRAYLTLPVGVNFFLAGYSYSSGEVIFDPTLPVEDVAARINTSYLGYMRSIDFFGRSASMGLVIPYTWGSLEGKYLGEQTGIRRSGLPDPQFRFATNLLGGPALSPRDFAGYRQDTNLGVSLVVSAPTGQYDPQKLINLSGNRWAFRPEIGLSQAFQKWHFDVYLGGWFFTDNKEFAVASTRSQKPIGSLQGHVSYNLSPRLWAAFDATFYTGGRTEVDGVPKADLQRNSRVGATLSIPLARRQSLKFGVSRGAFTSIGADFVLLSFSYQIFWF